MGDIPDCKIEFDVVRTCVTGFNLFDLDMVLCVDRFGGRTPTRRGSIFQSGNIERNGFQYIISGDLLFYLFGGLYDIYIFIFI